MKKAFDLAVEWVCFEIHPETPSEGILLAQKFAGYDMDRMYEKLRRNWAHLGIEFGPMKLLSNSHLALEAYEFARDHGTGEIFHAGMYWAYFVETRDIGGMEEVLRVGQTVGLDATALREALEKKQYIGRLNQAQQEAHRLGINAVPTFIINGRTRIVGAQPLDVFRNTLRQLETD